MSNSTDKRGEVEGKGEAPLSDGTLSLGSYPCTKTTQTFFLSHAEAFRLGNLRRRIFNTSCGQFRIHRRLQRKGTSGKLKSRGVEHSFQKRTSIDDELTMSGKVPSISMSFNELS